MITIKTARSLSKREYGIVAELASLKLNLFTLEQVSKIFKVKKTQLWAILHRLEKKGWIERIEKGKYMAVPFTAKDGWLENPYIIASKLVDNYYISYRTALSYHGLTEQLPRHVYVATIMRKAMLEKKIQNYIFKFIRLSPRKFFGFKLEKIDLQEICLAEPEKAIVDCLDKEKYSGSIVEIIKALNSAKINIHKLKRYAVKMENSSLVRRLGYLLDLLEKDSSGLEKHIGRYRPVYLSTSLPEKSLMKSRKWKLIINIKEEDLLRW
ncbi:TPA: hypothetical protein HA246_06170 [Candidatus Woesearchaeota archaeon]|nr:hypothetical protein [Candidatus Woesearchaeota archaeon]